MGKFNCFEEYLNLFPEKPRKKVKNGWLIICPAHNDNNPSLLIKPSDKKGFIACLCRDVSK